MERVKQLWKEGKPLKQICTATGMGQNKVLKIIKDLSSSNDTE